jgi:hypothetical protein
MIRNHNFDKDGNDSLHSFMPSDNEQFEVIYFKWKEWALSDPSFIMKIEVIRVFHNLQMATSNDLTKRGRKRSQRYFRLERRCRNLYLLKNQLPPNQQNEK